MSEAPPIVTAAAPTGQDQRHYLRRYVGLPENGFTWTTALIAFFTALIVGSIGSIIVAGFDPGLDTNAGKLCAQLAVTISFIGAALMVALTDAGGRLKAAFDRFGLRRFATWMLGIAAVAWIGYFIVQIGVSALISPEQQDVTEELGTNESSAISIAATALIVIAGAAISEELLFRGVIFAGLRKSMSLWPAALLSSGVWGLLHTVSGNLAVAAVLTIFGLALAWSYERSGSLWVPICAHAFNNTLAVLALFLA